jgi:hypothetical protein
MKKLLSILAFVFVVDTASIDAAVPRGVVSDQQIAAEGQLVASSAHLEIYQHGATVDPSFLKVMEGAYEQVQRVTGLKLDTATLGFIVRVYVSGSVGVSHVWKGYQHPSDPKAVIFLNPRVYSGAMSGKNATHIHELTHLFTWRYNSHTLREGIADYVALTILPGAAIGPNTGGSASPQIPPEVFEHLGTTIPPPEWVSTDPARRSAYYYASYRFVKYLIEMKGMETFLKLYVSENPEMDLRTLYGLGRQEVIQAAFAVKP